MGTELYDYGARRSLPRACTRTSLDKSFKVVCLVSIQMPISSILIQRDSKRCLYDATQNACELRRHMLAQHPMLEVPEISDAKQLPMSDTVVTL